MCHLLGLTCSSTMFQLRVGENVFCYIRYAPTAISCTALFPAVENYVIRQLAESKQQNKEVLGALMDLKQVQLDIFHRLTQLENLQKGKGSTEKFDADDFNIPLSTMEDFTEMEKLLENKDERRTLVRALIL